MCGLRNSSAQKHPGRRQVTGVLASIMVIGGVPVVMLSSLVSPWLARRVQRRKFAREARRAIRAILSGDGYPAPDGERLVDLADDDAGEGRDLKREFPGGES
jgi:hypothetical protein